jgi:hypothetical protein
MIIEPGFLEHWKTRLLVDRLGEETAPLRLIKLWEFCQLRKAWEFPFTAIVLKAVCGWQGDATAFWEAMTDGDSGWLVPAEEGRWEVRGFRDLNGKLCHNWRVGSIPKGKGKTGSQSEATGKPEASQMNSTPKPPGSQKEAKTDLATPLGQAHSIALHSVAKHSNLSVTGDGPPGPVGSGDDGVGGAPGGSREEGQGRSAEPEPTEVGTPTASLSLQVESDPARSLAEWCERIYGAYPRKVARSNALRSIEKVLRKKEKGGAPEEVLAATLKFAQAVGQWPTEDRQFVPHPATWFNGGRFLDDPSEWVRDLVPGGGQKGKRGRGFEGSAGPVAGLDVIGGMVAAPVGWEAVAKALLDHEGTWEALPPSAQEEVRRECGRRG